MMKCLFAIFAVALVLTGQTRIVGSGTDQIIATVRGADGHVYATGVTNSPDFPTTTVPSSRPSAEDYRPFVLKLNQQGQVIYSTLISAPTASPRSIAVNAKGEVLIAGQSVELGEVRFPVTPGSVGDGGANTGFIIKLDATGSKVLVGIRGYGLGPVAYDSDDNIYVAGAAYGNSEIRPTPGAFQTTHENQGCGGTSFVGVGCFYQYLAKISPDGTKLLYSTFLTGSFGAQPSALLIDGAGNALVAGTTNSRDYPTTAGSFQPEYRASNPPPPPSSLRPSINPPASTGYLTKLNATGTVLVWSTYFSGTGAESIRSVRHTDDGGLFITGLSASRDLPMAQGLPRGCPLGSFPEIPYVAELSGDGKTLAGSHYVYDIEIYTMDRVAVRPDGTAEIIGGASTDVEASIASPYICLVDSADNARLNQVAPGQLVTLFGDFAEGMKVSINGLPAPLLYASAEQVNVQAPSDLAVLPLVQVSVANPDGTVNTRPISVIARAPSAFLDLTRSLSPIATCAGESFSPSYAAITRNEDGSLNSCDHPAPKGSVVTFYLNGLGRTAPAVTLSAPEVGRIVALEPDPDSPSGVWRMRVQLAPNVGSGSIVPMIEGARLRYSFLTVWVAR
jgi:uncharacterized protein (TIGR03437 family)